LADDACRQRGERVNFAIAATAFAVVVPAELPDKTFISCVVLASRHRPLPVWCGAVAGLVLQAGIAAAAGRLLDLAPHRAVEWVVAALFLGGGAFLLLGSEKDEEAAGTRAASRADGESVAQVPALRIAATTFAVVALAEMGDLPQVVVADLSARDGSPVSVFAGAAVAFVLLSAVGVALGRTITRVVPLVAVRRLSGLVLLGLAVWSAVGAAGG
jgi:putative Ca2+/H+ antiporter (TMEM165/GDT1 family)